MSASLTVRLGDFHSRAYLSKITEFSKRAVKPFESVGEYCGSAINEEEVDLHNAAAASPRQIKKPLIVQIPKQRATACLLPLKQLQTTAIIN
jgi:hypothetical protein